MFSRASIAVAAALAALVTWSFYERWSVLASSPFPLGIDGYYYPLQIRELLEHGHLLYSASPLVFWLAAPVAALTDPIVGVKIVAALGGALVALPAYGIGARLGAGRGPGLVAAALATASCGSAYLSIEFVKNGVAITIALAAVWLALRALERAPAGEAASAAGASEATIDEPMRRGRVVAAAIAIVAAALAHVMAIAIVVAIVAPAALAGRRRTAIAIVAGATVVAVALALAFLQRLPSLAGLVSTRAYWTLPALALPSGAELAFGSEALIAGGLAIAAALVLARRKIEQPRADRAASWALVAFGAIVAVPWLDVADPQGLALRLRIVAFVPLAACGAIVARWARVGTLGCAALAVAIVLVPRDRREGLVQAPPYMVSAAISLDGKIPDGDTLVVSERHLAYMAAWYARVPVSLRPEPVAPEHRWRLMTLDGFIGRDSALEHALDDARAEPSLAPPIGLLARHRDGVVLVAEPTWRWILAHLPERARAHYARWPTL
jgi:hypothetical protein